MFERYSVISWQIDADISFNRLEYGLGAVPSSCLSQTRGPSCCHNFRSFASPLSVLIRPCGHLTAPLKSSGCHSNHLKLLRCCSWYSASEYMPLGPPGSLLSSGEQTWNKRVRQKRVLQKKEEIDWLMWMPLPFVQTIISGWTIWYYYFIPPILQMGKVRHGEGKCLVRCLMVSHRQNEDWAETFRLLAQCSFSYTRILFKLFMAHSFPIVFSRDLRFERKARKRVKGESRWVGWGSMRPTPHQHAQTFPPKQLLYCIVWFWIRLHLARNLKIIPPEEFIEESLSKFG